MKEMEFGSVWRIYYEIDEMTIVCSMLRICACTAL